MMRYDNNYKGERTMRKIKVAVVLLTGLLSAACLTGCKEKLVDVELFVEENYELYGSPEFSSYKDFELANSFTGKSEAAAKAKWEKAVRREKKLIELKKDAVAKVCRAADEQADKIENVEEMMKPAQAYLKLMGWNDFSYECRNPIAGHWVEEIANHLLEGGFREAAEDALEGNKRGLEEATEIAKEYIKYMLSALDAAAGAAESGGDLSGLGESLEEGFKEMIESWNDKYKAGMVYMRPLLEEIHGEAYSF